MVMNRQGDGLLGCQSEDSPSIRLTIEDLILAHNDCFPCLRRDFFPPQALWLGETLFSWLGDAQHALFGWPGQVRQERGA